ncbi:hypothetical protein AB0M29_41765 [Streptomyces sp. NPDC051976]|uniref:hypothetical protein n=1 Tax=Streptomyces sp. NPDC051976 TaxID=3154947 RepID=UPI0034185A79
MSQPSPRGWSLAVATHPAADIAAMPRDLQRGVVNFLSALAIEAGSAIEAGKRPPGTALDDVGLRYSIVVFGEPVVCEFIVVPGSREVRLTTLVWLH